MKEEKKAGNRCAKGYIVLALFAALLTLSVILGFSLVAALLGGYLLFFIYALSEKMTVAAVLKISLRSILTVKNILITFILIGMLTGLWRACGTVAAIVDYAAALVQPSVMLLLTFLLNCLISLLTGTAFGTAATMGTICMTMATAIGYNPLYVGGAVLAGAYFGDRCSPVSTSALLVSELTGTNVYENIKKMIKTMAVPFAVSIILYYCIGKFTAGSGAFDTAISDAFHVQFRLGPVPLIPAVVILILAACRVKVKIAMAVSIVSAAAVALFYQQIGVLDVLRCALTGYNATVTELGSLLDGGGITSMIKVTLIVCISSCYSGIFERTGLLAPLQSLIAKATQKTSAFVVMIPVSAVIGMIACNQTLTIMLTDQLCKPLEEDKQKLALYLEDTAVVIAPLIPWSIAGTVPLTSCGAPAGARLFAFILYLLPLWDILYFKINGRVRRRDVRESLRQKPLQ